VFTGLLLVSSLVCSSCVSGYYPDNGAGNGNRGGLVSPSGRRFDPNDGMQMVEAKHPALSLAMDGRFDEARGYVERGEDEQRYYEQGVRYYNYWAPRTNRRDEYGRPDASWGDILNNENERNVRYNEEEAERMQARAANGDEEAKAWLRKYGYRIKGARAVQDGIEEDRVRSGY